jgi:hypothetical protein
LFFAYKVFPKPPQGNWSTPLISRGTRSATSKVHSVGYITKKTKKKNPQQIKLG